MQYLGPRYLETIGSPVLKGREFDRTDTATSRKVALVNEAFVRYFLDSDPHPLGHVLSFDDSKQEGGAPTFIVGVIGNILHRGFREKIEPTVYVPLSQMHVQFPPAILLRTQLPQSELLSAIYRELHALGPAAAIWEPQTLRQHVDDSIFRERLLATLGGFFGGLALLLAAIGLYGVVSYGTARRAGEIGVRIALGAQRGQVLWMVLRDALALVLLGLAAGLPAALAAARMAGSLLFDVKAEDPLTFALTAGALAVIGLAAAWLPARRAARMDPMGALRNE